MWTERFTQAALGAIARDGIAQFFTGDECGACLCQLIGTDSQYDKRVGKCASFLPHPLYVGLLFQAPRAFHAFSSRPDRFSNDCLA